MNGLLFFILTAFAVGIQGESIKGQQKDPPPNIVWIFSDDQGYNDIGFRNPDVITPNLDRLAREGVILTNHYVQPLCTPTRSALLTGRYPFRTGMQHGALGPNQPSCLGLQYKLLPEYLKTLGYSTHALGKWHLGFCRWECTPLYRGFDSFSGGYVGAGQYYQHVMARRYDWHDGYRVNLTAKGIHSQDLILERSMEILDSADPSSPFFLYLAFHNPHSPYQPKPEFEALYDNLTATPLRKAYLGLVTGMDYVIGQIMDKLSENGLAENTIVIFASDNGGEFQDTDNSPFRGAKWSLWEGATKSSSFIWSPLLDKTSVEHNGLIHVADWLPTLVTLAGGRHLLEKNLDGVDQSRLVKNGGPSKRTHMVYNIDREYNIGRPMWGEIAVRNKFYKLIWGMPGMSDGYSPNVDIIFNIPYYRNYVNSHRERTRSTRQAAGPGRPGGPGGGGAQPPDDRQGGDLRYTEEEWFYLNTFMDLVKVTDRKLNAGQGYMQLFNLRDDPSETTNLVDSTDPEDQEALKDLIQMVQNEIKKGYVHMAEENWGSSPLFASLAMMTPGWCNDTVPLPS